MKLYRSDDPFWDIFFLLCLLFILIIELDVFLKNLKVPDVLRKCQLHHAHPAKNILPLTPKLHIFLPVLFRDVIYTTETPLCSDAVTHRIRGPPLLCNEAVNSSESLQREQTSHFHIAPTLISGFKWTADTLLLILNNILKPASKGDVASRCVHLNPIQLSYLKRITFYFGAAVSKSLLVCSHIKDFQHFTVLKKSFSIFLFVVLVFKG